jgi:acyl-coenzyme A thioesterase PaaI-like protein
MTSSSTDLLTDSVAAWFGVVVRRTGTDTSEIVVPLPPLGSGGSVLARLIQSVDVAAGVSACLAVSPRTALTADIALHVLDPRAKGDLVAHGSMARVGRGQAVANVDVVDERGVLVATATANHGIREQEVRMYLHGLEPGDHFDLAPYRTAPEGSLAEVFVDDVGEMPVNAWSVNPWNVAQGALMATLIEPAAERAGLQHIEDLIIRFLAPATAGPVYFAPDTVRHRAGNSLLRGSLGDRGTGRTVALISATGPSSPGADS